VNAVTLEVSPPQAEELDLARSVGTLSLVLRNQVDPKPGGTEGATKMSLLKDEHDRPKGVAIPAPAAVKQVVAARPAPRIVAAAPPKASNCVEVIRGTVRTMECF
jgi:pilus assembly protein CpaB